MSRAFLLNIMAFEGDIIRIKRYRGSKSRYNKYYLHKDIFSLLIFNLLISNSYKYNILDHAIFLGFIITRDNPC